VYTKRDMQKSSSLYARPSNSASSIQKDYRARQKMSGYATKLTKQTNLSMKSMALINNKERVSSVAKFMLQTSWALLRVCWALF